MTIVNPVYIYLALILAHQFIAMDFVPVKLYWIRNLFTIKAWSKNWFSATDRLSKHRMVCQSYYINGIR